MKSYISLRTILVTLALIGSGGFLVSYVYAQTAFQSVELGIAELSPRGAGGGVAMPASGGSIKLYYKEADDSEWLRGPGNSTCTGCKSSSAGSGSWGNINFNSTANSGSTPTNGGGKVTSGSLVDLIAVGNTADSNYKNCEFKNLSGGYQLVDGELVYTAPDPNASYRAPAGTFDLKRDIDDLTYTMPGANTNRFFTYPDGVTQSTYYLQCNGSNHLMDSGNKGRHIYRTTLTLQAVAPACSDGDDNDGDGISDENDPGCHTDGDPNNPGTYDPDDSDETDPVTDPTLALQACDQNGSCVNEYQLLSISDGDEVTLNWQSENTDFCDSIGTFTMPSGSPTSASNVAVVEPASGETKVFWVACGNDGDVQISRPVYVRLGSIELVPHPYPAIVPAEGMPADDPATVTPYIFDYSPDLCTLSGPGANGRTITALTTAGELVDGSFEVEGYLNNRGETTYTLECRESAGADPVSDEALFRILPEIQET